jgi:hypothetical protein
MTVSLSANFALKKQLDSKYEELSEAIKATRNPALCTDYLIAYLEIYQKLEPSDIEKKHSDRHENLANLLDKFALKLSEKALSLSDSNRSIQGIELNQFLQKMRPAKLEVYEESINKLEMIASSSSAKLKIDAIILKCRDKLSKGKIDLIIYKQLVKLVNQNMSVLSPKQKETISELEVQLLKHFESYAFYCIDNPLNFNLEELSLRFTACQLYGDIIGTSHKYKKAGLELGTSIAMELDSLALSCGNYFDNQLNYIIKKDKLDYNNLPSEINITVNALQKKLEIIEKIDKTINDSKDLNYSIIKHINKSTLATCQRDDLINIINTWHYLQLVAVKNIPKFSDALNLIPDEFIHHRVGRGEDLIAAGKGCIYAEINKLPSYAHAQRAEYLRSISSLFNSVDFSDYYQDLLKESLASQLDAVKSLRDLRMCLEQYAFIDSRNPDIVSDFNSSLIKLLVDLGNGKAIKKYYTAHNFYKVCAEMYSIRLFIVEYLPDFKTACEKSFHKGFLNSNIPEIKLCEQIKVGLLNKNFNNSRYRKIQKDALAYYKKSFKNASLNDRAEMLPPRAISEALDEEFNHIKYATPINKKTMTQFISQDGLFEKILSSVHSNKLDLEVLKGIKRLLEKNSIIDLSLPFESIYILSIYYYVVEPLPFISHLFDIYKDCSEQNFGSVLLPFSIGYPAI